MDRTPLGFPYPECEPPRVKDISDIAQLKALAEAVDATVQQTADDLDSQLVSPRAARMRESVASAWPGGTANPHLDQITFASAGMGDTTAGGIRITQSGWYLVGGYGLIIVASGTQINARMTVVRNNVNAIAYGDASRLVTGTAADAYVSTTLELEEGDLLTPRFASAGAAYTLTSHLWALELLGA